MPNPISRRALLGNAALAAGTPVLLQAAPPTQKRPKRADLLKRGEPEVYRGNELKFIGMPVGGLFAGTLYLGGDGQLWNWDIFNRTHVGAIDNPDVVFQGDHLREPDGANYVEPHTQQSPFRQVFHLLSGNRVVKFGDISFRGEYPVGKVEYRQADADVEMSLVAFSPFCPLDVDSSSFPATTMTFRVKNIGAEAASYSLAYTLDNPVLCLSKKSRNDFVLSAKPTASGGLQFQAEIRPNSISVKTDITFEDWSSGTYGKWIPSGTAFGSTPRKVSELPSYMGQLHAGTEFVVNSHQTRNGEDVVAGDAHTGRLTSPEFTIQRKYINMRVGGGAHAGKTCVNVLVDGAILSVTGHESNAMRWESIDVSGYLGKTATIEVVDEFSGPWGNIGLGEVVFSDRTQKLTPLNESPDFGTFCVEAIGAPLAVNPGDESRLAANFTLKPGEVREVTFVIAWHFPNADKSLPGKTNWYTTKWSDASAVAGEIVRRWEELKDKTLGWNGIWYDSTLPHWFLDRTFLNTSILATTTCHRFLDGRFYFWEGTGCCAGTCTHVWGYAQAIGRVFPEVEQYLREKIDFGMAFHKDSGRIDYRAEYGKSVAHDGQCGCILRAYREHQMSSSKEFLTRIWPQVKKATEFLIGEDGNSDGLLEGAQYNTLDAAWHGKIAWISSLYVAALRASEAMATAMGDGLFATKCKEIAERGTKNLVKELFNGEYFIHKIDPAHPESNNTNNGCHIDQLYGQAWAMQVGLPRVVPVKESVTALKSLFKYSFYEDIWEYRRKVKGIPGGRWYAMPGEPGLIMCSFPHGGAAESVGKGGDAWATGYFNECMTGFEHQAAAHMIAEGLLTEGLKVVYAIHQRYHPSNRNPYNEIECSDHYGRAMASYGAFVSICGFVNDGPSQTMKFNPRVSGAFRCPFVNASGWGTYSRSADGAEKVVYRHRVGG